MKKMFLAGSLLLCLAALLPAAGCAKKIDLTDYVSEFRSDIYTGTQEEYSVFASVSYKEYPYVADGNVGETEPLLEVTLSVPDNTKTYSLSFSYGEIEKQAELSFDSVMMVHTWSESLPAPSETEIEFTITSDEEDAQPVCITAKSAKQENTLSLSDLLTRVSQAESDRFAALTSERSFLGEMYVRLLYEADDCFYYIGLIDRNGKVYSMLADAETGEIIATREQPQ